MINLFHNYNCAWKDWYSKYILLNWRFGQIYWFINFIIELLFSHKRMFLGITHPSVTFHSTCIHRWSFSVRFGFYKKQVTKLIFFFKKNQNQFKPVWLGFFGFFRFDSVFSWFVFVFGFCSVQFFHFQAYKTKTEPVGFFKILIGFFSWFDFFGLIGFSDFLLTPTCIY